MRSKSLTVVLVLFACSLAAHASNPGLVNCAQLLSWMAGGIPEQRLVRLAGERGITFQVDRQTAKSLRSAGASSSLIRDLNRVRTGSEHRFCPAQLVRIARLVHQRKYDQAEPVLRRLLATGPRNPDLHLALGYVRQQQNDDNQAFDQYSEAKELFPGFPEIHNGLAFIFYRSHDGENTIAEARTALSIDPQNAEGYRYLGLGLLAKDEYPAAVHAFQESLVRDRNNAETYNGLGRAQNSGGNLAGAAASYLQALHLNPRLREARKNLAEILYTLSQQPVFVVDHKASDQASGENPEPRKSGASAH